MIGCNRVALQAPITILDLDELGKNKNPLLIMIYLREGLISASYSVRG